MKYAIIENNKVINVAKSETALADNWIQSNVAKIGDTYNSETDEFISPHPEPEPIPQRISMRRARLVLLDKGLLASIQGAIDSLPEPEKSAAQIEWDYSTEVWRTKPFVLAIAQGLGWTEQDLDNLFREAMDKKYD